MATDTKGIARRLRIEADCRRDHDGEDTVFNMSNCHFTEGMPTAFGMDGMDIYADMRVYGLFDRLADLIDRPDV